METGEENGQNIFSNIQASTTNSSETGHSHFGIVEHVDNSNESQPDSKTGIIRSISKEEPDETEKFDIKPVDSIKSEGGDSIECLEKDETPPPSDGNGSLVGHIGKDKNITSPPQEKKQKLSGDRESEETEKDSVLAFREAIQGILNCILMKTGSSSKNVDGDGIKVSVEGLIQSVQESSRKLELEFNKHQIFWTTQRPDLAIKEDIDRLKNEINRKDVALQRVKDKMKRWEDTLGASRPTNNPLSSLSQNFS